MLNHFGPSYLPSFPKEFSSPLGDGELQENTATVLLLIPHGIYPEALHTVGAQAMPSGRINREKGRERGRGEINENLNE